MVRHQVWERLVDDTSADSHLFEFFYLCSLSIDFLRFKIQSLSFNLGLIVHRESITRLSSLSLQSLRIILHCIHVLLVLDGSHTSKHFFTGSRLNRYFFLGKTLRRQSRLHLCKVGRRVQFCAACRPRLRSSLLNDLAWIKHFLQQRVLREDCCL